MKDNKATTPLEAAMKKARDGVALARKEAEAGAARMSVFRLYLAADDLALIVEEVDRLRGSAVFASLLLAALEDPDVTPEDETRAALDLRRALGGEPIDPLAALEAAERALLVAAKWKSDPEDRWCDPEDGRWCGRAFAVEVERTRREKKAGAL